MFLVAAESAASDRPATYELVPTPSAPFPVSDELNDPDPALANVDSYRPPADGGESPLSVMNSGAPKLSAGGPNDYRQSGNLTPIYLPLSSG